MALSKSQLNSDLNSLITDPLTGQNTALKVRQIIKEVIDNSLNIVDSATASVTLSSPGGQNFGINSALIGSPGSYIGATAVNTSVIGAVGLTATNSNTIYIGNSGQQVIIGGTAALTLAPTLNQILTNGNLTNGKDIVLGVADRIKSSVDKASIALSSTGVMAMTGSTVYISDYTQLSKVSVTSVSSTVIGNVININSGNHVNITAPIYCLMYTTASTVNIQDGNNTISDTSVNAYISLQAGSSAATSSRIILNKNIGGLSASVDSSAIGIQKGNNTWVDSSTSGVITLTTASSSIVISQTNSNITSAVNGSSITIKPGSNRWVDSSDGSILVQTGAGSYATSVTVQPHGYMLSLGDVYDNANLTQTIKSYYVHTVGATPYIVATMSIPADNQTVYVDVNVMAFCHDDDKGLCYRLDGGFKSNGAVTSLGVHGGTSSGFTASNVTLTTDGTYVLLTVIGDVGRSIEWNSKVSFLYNNGL